MLMVGKKINLVLKYRAKLSVAKSIYGNSKSEVIRLNHELQQWHQKQYFEEEEPKLFEKRRDKRLTIIEVQQQLSTQETDSKDDIKSFGQLVNLFEDSDYLNK